MMMNNYWRGATLYAKCLDAADAVAMEYDAVESVTIEEAGGPLIRITVPVSFMVFHPVMAFELVTRVKAATEDWSARVLLRPSGIF
jgi:hypothetical protein